MKIRVDAEIELKELESSDAEIIFQTIDNEREHLGKWLPFVEHTKKISDTVHFVESVVNAPENCYEYVFTIWKNQAFAGLIGFRNTDRTNKKSEIGYWLSLSYRKQGIISKSLYKLTLFAFQKLFLNRIEIKCAVENQASRKIPERLGYKFEGIERHGELLSGNIFTDLAIYSMLKDEFEPK